MYADPAARHPQGATHSFFVTAMLVAPGTKPRPRGRGHRHSSVAVNYHFSGSGVSTVAGQDISWEAGDLLLSAPGWLEHAHYQPGPEGFGAYTVRVRPVHIGMESLVDKRTCAARCSPWARRQARPATSVRARRGSNRPRWPPPRLLPHRARLARGLLPACTRHESRSSVWQAPALLLTLARAELPQRVNHRADCRGVKYLAVRW